MMMRLLRTKTTLDRQQSKRWIAKELLGRFCCCFFFLVFACLFVFSNGVVSDLSEKEDGEERVFY